jgi:hypothetical protein
MICKLFTAHDHRVRPGEHSFKLKSNANHRVRLTKGLKVNVVLRWKIESGVKEFFGQTTLFSFFLESRTEQSKNLSIRK